MNSFYREENIVVRPKELKEVYYGLGESPNHFFVNNLSNAELFCGITNIPSEDFHEAAVDAGGTRILARRDGSTRFYIYNASNSETAHILLTSFYDVFNPTTLAMSNLKVFVDMSGVVLENDGEIHAFKCSLPSGNNTIGAVTLNPGNNKVGFVGVDTVPQIVEQASTAAKNNLPTIATQVSNAAGYANDIKNLVAAGNQIWTNEKIQQVLSAINSIAAVAGGAEFTGTLKIETETISSAFTINLAAENKYINNLNYIRCTAGTITLAINGGTDVITLAEGDVVNDVSGRIDTLTVSPVGGNASFEMLYSFITE